MSASNAFFSKITKHGKEESVITNHSALIKKILGRYSSNFVVFRELIQNSDDAQAKSFQLQFICDSPSDLAEHQHITTNHQRIGLFENIGKFFRNRFQNTKESSDEDDNELTSNAERKFHNKIITEIRTVNDGLVFTEKDWKRVATIAEGNTNVDAIGQFGVGFFTVFSYSDRPMIKSGKQCMAFDWKDNQSLTTFRDKLIDEEQSTTTSVILIMRDKYMLDTKSTNNFENKQSEIVSSNIKNNVVPKINLTQLKVYFLKVLSFTKHINELTITIDGETVFKVKKIQKSIPSFQTALTFKESHPMNTIPTEIFRCISFVHTEQIYKITHGSSLTLDYIDVEMSVNIEQELHDQIRNIIQKNLPSTIHIKFLFPSRNNLQFPISDDNNLHTQILNSLIPLKFEKNKIIPCGQIFIGLSTHQSTGLGIHVHSQFIPTVERENLDFQNPYIKRWNKEILKSIGKILRVIYDQIILRQSEDYHSLLAIYSFLPTVPNTDIGHIVLKEFVSSKKNLLVPVKQTPSDNQFSLIPSTQAFLSNSELICLFLSKSIVRFDLGKNHFFTILRTYKLINDIDYSMIITDIHKSIFLLNEFIELLHWLCSKEITDKTYVQQILSNLHFRETIHSPIITLKNLEFYNGFKISPDLPLSSNILPSNIASYLSPEQLHKKLYLSEVSLEYLLNFYIYQKEQHRLFSEKKTSTYLLIFISQYWNQSNELIQEEIKKLLSQIQCIPTTKGMKLPKDSYIYSSNLSDKNLPVITLKISKVLETNKISSEELGNVVSIDFLKQIGCRTIYISTDCSIESLSNSEYNREYIQTFLKRQKNMSETDLLALKQSKSFIGTTLDKNANKTGKYLPQDLHFPSVAIELDWPSLLILDWLDIEPYSEEYLFLKDLGVRDIPELDKLIDRIVEEHQQLSMIIKEYELSVALSFLAKNFHKHYIKLWNIGHNQQAFLPCYYSRKMLDQNDDLNECKVLLEAPNNVYTDMSPLFPTPIPAVIKLFKSYFDISLINVKQRPTLDITFKKLMEIKNDILTVQTAPKLFAYLSTLDGLNRNLINSISEYAFIPLQDQNIFVKPTEVFIRSKNSFDQNNNAFVDEDNTNGLIDYIDYGSDANFFLEKVDVLHYPPPEILAKLLLDRQAKYFSDVKDNNDQQLSIKLHVYINCLKQLASYFTCRKQLHTDPLTDRLMNEPWCLGYQMDDSSKSSISKIVRPSEIYLNDDEQYLNVLQPLCAPEEPELVKLYEQFGAKWLSECVKRKLSHIGISLFNLAEIVVTYNKKLLTKKHFIYQINNENGIFLGEVTITEHSNQLLDLIQYRLDLLFVNKRGERMNNVDEQRIEILRTDLFVYETEAIQCQLTLKNKTIILDSAQCSSCILKSRNNQVKIYIQKNTSNFEYFDIANELARFIFKKPKEDIVDGISNKLSSSLEALKRRGIPVDRLLKQMNKQPSVKEHQQKSDEHSSKMALKSTAHYTNNSPVDQSIKPPVKFKRVVNVENNKSNDMDLISTVIHRGQAFTDSELNDSGHITTEPLSECETMPAISMTRYKDLFYSIPLFLHKNVIVTETMTYHAEQSACLLAGLATCVFGIPVNTMHLFQDIDENKIAFNKNGSIFFNLQYFEQFLAAETSAPFSIPSPSTLIKLINFYFIITCHELTHNKHSKHSLNFINDMQIIIVEFLPKKDIFLKQFAFTSYF